MKKYADARENQIYKKHEGLCDILKANLLKSLVYEKVISGNDTKRS